MKAGTTMDISYDGQHVLYSYLIENDLCINIHKSLADSDGQSLTAQDILAKIEHTEAKEKLASLLDLKYTFIDFVLIGLNRMEHGLWEINDKTHAMKRSIMAIISFLPWEAGQVLDLQSRETILVIINALNRACELDERKSGTLKKEKQYEPFRLSDDLFKKAHSAILKKFGKSCIVDFETIDEIDNIIAGMGWEQSFFETNRDCPKPADPIPIKPECGEPTK